MRPNFKAAEKAVKQVLLGTVLTLGFVLACTVLSSMV